VSSLIIVDLNFCESEFASKNAIKGGASKRYKVSAAADGDAIADAKADVKVDGTTVVYSLAYGVANGVASAVSFDRPAVAKVNVRLNIDAKVD
jgi:hypothetical protein